MIGNYLYGEAARSVGGNLCRWSRREFVVVQLRRRTGEFAFTCDRQLNLHPALRLWTKAFERHRDRFSIAEASRL